MSSSSSDPQLTSFPRFQRGTSRATVSAEIMVAAIVFFVMTVAFVVFLYLYARYRWGPGSSERRARERRLRRGHHANRVRGQRLPRGLDAAVLEGLPIKVYKPEEFQEEGRVECAVCLTEFADGEKVRMLPKCNHGFHVDCIDMWFASHATCPLCRDPVGKQHGESALEDETEGEEMAVQETTAATDAEDQASTEPPPNFPTNVLFWGTQDRVSSAAPVASTPEPEQEQAVVSSSDAGSSGSRVKPEGALVIDIPARVAAEGFSSSSSSPSSIRSGWAATPTRLRSFRRLFSREKRVAAVPGCSCEGGAGDIEQGVSGGAVSPKTPQTGTGRASTPKTPTQ